MMDKQNNHIVWAWAVKNSVDMICWTALAIIFGKWWIALFAAAFVSNVKFREPPEAGETNDG